jgi:hypothetical protein
VLDLPHVVEGARREAEKAGLGYSILQLDAV